MRRDEVIDYAGNCVSAVQYDPVTRTVTYEENGIVVSSRPMTQEEWDMTCDYPPLDAAGALATLLVVEGVLPLADAANAVNEEPDHLIAEAEAWSLG